MNRWRWIWTRLLSIVSCGLLLTSAGNAQVGPNNAGYKGGILGANVIFERNRWNRGNPDAAGCVTYTANANNAGVAVAPRANVLVPFAAANNARVIVCRWTIHMDPTVALLERVVPFQPGLLVLIFEEFRYEQDKWNQAAPQAVFGVRYTAGANNANVTFVNLRGRFTGIHLRGPNQSAIFFVDHVAHIDANIDTVRVDFQREGQPEPEELACSDDPWDCLTAGPTPDATRLVNGYGLDRLGALR